VKHTLISLLLCASHAYANTYYVDSVGGSDTNAGTSSSTPWKTIGKVNGTTLSPGDSVLFLRGDTFSDATLTISNSGNSTSPITFADYGSGNKPIISGNAQARNCTHAAGKNYIAIKNIVCDHGSYGFLFDTGGSNNTVKNVESRYNYYDGISFQGDSTHTSSNNMAAYAISHDNGRSGVSFYTSSSGLVINGVFYNNSATYGTGVNYALNCDQGEVFGAVAFNNYYGIKIDTGTSNVVVDYNVVFNNSNDGIDIDYAGTGNNVISNLAFKNGLHGIVVEGPSSYTEVYYNIAHDQTCSQCAGIMLDSGTSHNQVWYNLVYNNPYGVWSFGGSYDSIENNTSYGNENCVAIQNSASHETVENNIADSCTFTTLLVDTDSTTGLLTDYNDWHDNGSNSIGYGSGSSYTYYSLSGWRTVSSQDSHSIDAAPSFVSTTSSRFQLAARV